MLDELLISITLQELSTYQLIRMMGVVLGMQEVVRGFVKIQFNGTFSAITLHISSS
jgi:hypothetical protein